MVSCCVILLLSLVSFAAQLSLTASPISFWTSRRPFCND